MDFDSYSTIPHLIYVMSLKERKKNEDKNQDFSLVKKNRIDISHNKPMSPQLRSL